MLNATQVKDFCRPCHIYNVMYSRFCLQVDKMSSDDGPLVLLYLDGHGTVRAAGRLTAHNYCF